MPFNRIETLTAVSGNDDQQTQVTGTSSDDGLKRGLDSVLIKDDTATTALRLALQALKIALDGTLPRSVYNQYTTEVSGTTYTFTFRFSSVRQFIITVTDPGTTPGTSIEEINSRLLETGEGVRLTEDGFERLLEG